MLEVVAQREYKNSVDMFYPILADQVKYFKETEGGKKIMCKAFEDLAEKRAEERVLEEKKALAEKMLLRGRGAVEQIAEDLELSIEVVQELADLQPV